MLLEWLRRSLLMDLPMSTAPSATQASREEMSAARLPLAYRDSCAHLLIPLNQCRFREYYLPWKCEVSVRLPINRNANVAWGYIGLGRGIACLAPSTVV